MPGVMATPFGDRLQRAVRAAHGAKLAALLVTPSADLRYLTGYDAPPFERLTCLVVRPGADPVLLVPELEKPRAQSSPVGERVELATWQDGDDPYDALAPLLPDAGRFAATDRMWAVHLLGAQRVRPEAEFAP